jgi:hypothetical protein
VDPVTVGALLLAIASGAGEELSKRLWEGVVSLVRHPFHRKAAAGAVVPSGEAELAAFQQSPSDREKAVELAKTLLARSDADAEFRRRLESWWRQAEPIRASENWANIISGGVQHGPVFQGRDFSNITFSTDPAKPPASPT